MKTASDSWSDAVRAAIAGLDYNGRVNTEPSPEISGDAQDGAFKDRLAGLYVFGFAEIVAGVLAAIVGLVSMVFLYLRAGTALPDGAQRPTGIMALVFHSSIAVFASGLIVLGVGAMHARRWAWALNLILSWFAAFFAGSTAVGLCLYAFSRRGGGGLVVAILACSVAGIGPMAFLLFYRERDVELTCKTRDPGERWTDRHPLPVLAAVLWELWSALGRVLDIIAPADGVWRQLLSHSAAWGIGLVLLGCKLYAARAMLRLKIAGWWVAVSSQIVIAALVLPRVWAGHGVSSAWLQSSRVLNVLSEVLVLGFWLWVRRYFVRVKQ
jgi:hypothetical protein